VAGVNVDQSLMVGKPVFFIHVGISVSFLIKIHTCLDAFKQKITKGCKGKCLPITCNPSTQWGKEL
jgi:hypothetical protein